MSGEERMEHTGAFDDLFNVPKRLVLLRVLLIVVLEGCLLWFYGVFLDLYTELVYAIDVETPSELAWGYTLAEIQRWYWLGSLLYLVVVTGLLWVGVHWCCAEDYDESEE